MSLIKEEIVIPNFKERLITSLGNTWNMFYKVCILPSAFVYFIMRRNHRMIFYATAGFTIGYNITEFRNVFRRDKNLIKLEIKKESQLKKIIFKTEPLVV
jgi:hypothetical protein